MSRSLVLIILSLGAFAGAFSAHAEVVHALSALSTGMIRGEKVRKEDDRIHFKAVLHLLAEENAMDPTGKCSGLAIGSCVLTAAHCFKAMQGKVTARNGLGFESEVDKSTVSYPSEYDGKTALRSDIAVAKLKAKPEFCLSKDSLYEKPITKELKASETIDWSIDKWKEEGSKVVAGGFGDTVVEKAEGPLGSPAARLGRLVGNNISIRFPEKQEGTMIAVGSLGDLLFSRLELTLDQRKSEFAKLSLLDRFVRAKEWKEFYEAEQLVDNVLNKMEGLVLFPDPTRFYFGDSGGPLFQTIDGKVRVVGVASAITEKEKQKGKDVRIFNEQTEEWQRDANARLRGLVEKEAMFGAPIAHNYQWLIETIDKLGCEK